HAQVLDDDLLHALSNVAHLDFPLFAPTRRWPTGPCTSFTELLHPNLELNPGFRPGSALIPMNRRDEFSGHLSQLGQIWPVAHAAPSCDTGKYNQIIAIPPFT